jgi:hypothetical protein
MMENKVQGGDIKQLGEFINKLKKRNLVRVKEIAGVHINMADHIKTAVRDYDYNQVYNIEGKCIMAEDANRKSDDAKEIA